MPLYATIAALPPDHMESPRDTQCMELWRASLERATACSPVLTFSISIGSEQVG